jgi:hypothetical protein
MKATIELTTRFYQHLGELFFAIAKSDGTVRPEEENRLKTLVDKEWTKLEDSEDEFHSNAVYQMESVFQNLFEDFADADTAFDDFKYFFLEHEHLFTAKITDLILLTANSIASSFRGKNKSELNMLLNLEQLLKENRMSGIRTKQLDKNAIRLGLVEELKSALSDLRLEIGAVHESVDIDEEDTKDPEDFSHQSESSSLEQNLAQRVGILEHQLVIAESLSTASMSSIGPGALVITTNHYLYVSVAAHPFTIEEHVIVPISMDSPIYPKLKSSALGEAVVMGDSQEKIIAIA